MSAPTIKINGKGRKAEIRKGSGVIDDSPVPAIKIEPQESTEEQLG